jgi:hypothetical protein
VREREDSRLPVGVFMPDLKREPYCTLFLESSNNDSVLYDIICDIIRKEHSIQIRRFVSRKSTVTCHTTQIDTPSILHNAHTLYLLIKICYFMSTITILLFLAGKNDVLLDSRRREANELCGLR